jgi:glycine oxidase
MRAIGATRNAMSIAPRSIIIVGAGVIGLAIGRALARAGLDVQIFDRREVAREATWAAAGMLAAAAESEPGNETFFALARASRERWRQFADELQVETDFDLHYREGTTLVAAQSDAEKAQLRATVQYLRTLDEPARLVKEPHQIEPELADNVQLALFSPYDGQVDTRALGRALHQSLIRNGGQVHEHASVDDVVVDAGRVIGVRLGDETVSADHIVLASGAWCDFPSLRGVVPEIHPVKGQLLAFQAEPGRIKHIVWGQGVYVVPRKDGRIILGATMEDAGFDVSVDPATIQAQRAKAARVLPFLDTLDVCDAWSGLRPGSPDGLPVMGPSAIKGLTLAMGHFRNGILLAPITADLVGRSVIDGDIPPPLLPFLPNRFEV